MSSSDDPADPFLDHSSIPVAKLESTRRKWNRLRHWVFPTLTLLLLITNTATILVAQSRADDLDQICALHSSVSWNPILARTQIRYRSVKFDYNGTFFHPSSIYQLEANAATDDAWTALGINYGKIVVPADQAVKSGIPLDRVKVPEDYGGPGYPATVEVLHQLHCLNLLRESLYFNVDYYRNKGEGAFANPERVLKAHIGHCIETVRQSLMCAADTGLLPFVWVGNPPHPFPDFHQPHKCRNFEDIQQAAEVMQTKRLDDFHVVPHSDALILDHFP